MNRQEQMINGFTEMMKAFWGNQDLQAPSMEEIKAKQMTREEANEADKPKTLLDNVAEWDKAIEKNGYVN